MRRALAVLLFLSSLAGCAGDPPDEAASLEGPVSVELPVGPLQSGSCALGQPVGGPNLGYRLGSAACEASSAGISTWDGVTTVLVELTWDELPPTITDVQVSVEGPYGTVVAQASGADPPLRLAFPPPDASPEDTMLFVDVTGLAVDQQYTAWFSTFQDEVPDDFTAVA